MTVDFVRRLLGLVDPAVFLDSIAGKLLLRCYPDALEALELLATVGYFLSYSFAN